MISITSRFTRFSYSECGLRSLRSLTHMGVMKQGGNVTEFVLSRSYKWEKTVWCSALVEVVSAKLVLIDVDWSVLGHMIVAIVWRQSGGRGGNSMAMEGAHPRLAVVSSQGI